MDPYSVGDGDGGTGMRTSLDRNRLTAGLADAGVLNTQVLPRVGSTNTALMESLATQGWHGPILLATDDQNAGRGRAGHQWLTPAGAAVTFSLAIRPGLPQAQWGWLPLFTGLGVVRAITALTGLRVGLKWPNDVLVPEVGRELPGWGTSRKVAGILTEGASDDRTVVFGIGINLDQTAPELPVAQAASLRTVGVTGVDRTDLLLAAAIAVASLVCADPGQSVREEVRTRCLTLGQAVTATVPGGRRIDGDAVAIDDSGALRLRRPDGSEQVLLAGDVHHVRPAGELGSIG